MKYCHLCTDKCTKRRLEDIPGLHDEPSEELQDEALDRISWLVKSTSRLLTTEGLICLDFADLRSVTSEMGLAVMGVGEASGEGRAIRAAEAAIADLKAQLYAAGLGAVSASKTEKA